MRLGARCLCTFAAYLATAMSASASPAMAASDWSKRAEPLPAESLAEVSGFLVDAAGDRLPGLAGAALLIQAGLFVTQEAVGWSEHARLGGSIALPFRSALAAEKSAHFRDAFTGMPVRAQSAGRWAIGQLPFDGLLTWLVETTLRTDEPRAGAATGSGLPLPTVEDFKPLMWMLEEQLFRLVDFGGQQAGIAIDAGGFRGGLPVIRNPEPASLALWLWLGAAAGVRGRAGKRRRFCRADALDS